MASFNSTPSAFPRQAVVASATLPPKAPAPSFFGGNTADANPSAPVVDPTPPADTFTATAPDPADAKKAEAAKKENGFVKFAKSPWGIGTGVLLAGGAVTALIAKPWEWGSSINKLEKVVKDLGIDDLDPEHKNNLLQKFAEHLQGLTANTSEHTPETWDKLSSAIVDVHAKHGGHEDGQIALLHGLGDSTPENLKDLSVEARKALVNTSNEYLEWVKKEPLKEGDETNFHAPLLGKAAEWLLHPHGEGLGIQNADDLVETSGALSSALYKLRPKGERLSDIHKAVLGFMEPNLYNRSSSPVSADAPPIALEGIKDLTTAGKALFDAGISGNEANIKAVLDHLNTKGIQGYGDLSKPDGFKDLEARLLPNVEVDNPTTDKRPAWYQWSGDINDSFFWKICKKLGEPIGRFKNSGTP